MTEMGRGKREREEGELGRRKRKEKKLNSKEEG